MEQIYQNLNQTKSPVWRKVHLLYLYDVVAEVNDDKKNWLGSTKPTSNIPPNR